VLMARSRPPTSSAISLPTRFSLPLGRPYTLPNPGLARRFTPQARDATKIGRRRMRAPRNGLEQLGERIRTLRTERGLSQAQLGAPYFTRAHVSAIELGKILPALTTLVHFARKLGVHTRDLLPP
jgi:ribosome-binding protein aMBF1 (putative translation factor)